MGQDNSQGQQPKGEQAMGNENMHVMRNSVTGEERQVTEADWQNNYAGYLKQGFTKPEGIKHDAPSAPPSQQTVSTPMPPKPQQ